MLCGGSMIPLLVLILASAFTVRCSSKNVLLFIFDDLRPSLGCYGDEHAVTPNIDKLARDGIVFKRAYSQQALCAPSRTSFLTSRRPDTLGLYDFNNYWRTFSGNYTTLPQYFKENGYFTKSIGKVFHPGITSNFSDDQPYSWSEPAFHPKTLKYKNAEVCTSPEEPMVPHADIVCPVHLHVQPENTLPDIESTEEAIRFLKTASSMESPFFLAVGFHKPHIPLKYPRHFNDFHPLGNVKLPKHRSRPPGMPNIAWNPWVDLRKRHDIMKLNLTFPYGRISDDKSKLIVRSYYASVTYVDSLLGRITDELRRSELYNNTVIALLGDHGWSLGEHGEWSKYSNYEVAARVPLIIRAPQFLTNSAKPLMKSQIVELVDVFPSLAYLAGLPEVPFCDTPMKHQQLCSEGKNIFLDASVNEAFSQYPRPSVNPRQDSDEPKLKNIKYMGYSIRTKRYRYTEWVTFHNFTPEWSNLIASELYDHSNDEDEVNNVAESGNYRDVRQFLSRRLHNQGNPSVKINKFGI